MFKLSSSLKEAKKFIKLKLKYSII